MDGQREPSSASANKPSQAELAKGVLLGWAVSWSLGFFSPTYVAAPVVLGVAIVALVRCVRRRRAPGFAIMALWGYVLRIAGSAALLHAFQTRYATVDAIPDFAARPLFFLVALPDQGSYEAAVRVLATRARCATPGQVDPFSGVLLKTGPAGDVYSVGPDLVDDGALLVYDPTNGTVSGGDILATSPDVEGPIRDAIIQRPDPGTEVPG